MAACRAELELMGLSEYSNSKKMIGANQVSFRVSSFRGHVKVGFPWGSVRPYCPHSIQIFSHFSHQVQWGLANTDCEFSSFIHPLI